MVLAHQGLTLIVTLGTIALTAYLFVVIPKGFFPVQDTGVIQGISQADQSVSYEAMAERQQALADVVLKDPDVASLSSFIGVDGQNVTLNSGRFLINLKPKEQRKDDASAIIRRLTTATANVPGVRLYMQPVQDLTIDTAVSATQYQVILENPNLTDFETLVPRYVERFAAHRSSPTSPATTRQRLGRLRHHRPRDGGPLRHHAATIDNVLYTTPRQRIVSTIFTQSNQYRFILEADPALHTSLESLNNLYLPSSTAPSGQVPLSAVAKVEERRAPLLIGHLGQFPATTVSFNLAPGWRSGRRWRRWKRRNKTSSCPRASTWCRRARSSPSRPRSRNELFLVCAAIVTVYIVLACSTRASSTPSPSSRPCRPRPSVRCSAECSGFARHHRDHRYIVLLIGIVKKNAIMMIDFALQPIARRQAPREAIYEACLLRFPLS